MVRVPAAQVGGPGLATLSPHNIESVYFAQCDCVFARSGATC